MPKGVGAAVCSVDVDPVPIAQLPKGVVTAVLWVDAVPIPIAQDPLPNR